MGAFMLVLKNWLFSAVNSSGAVSPLTRAIASSRPVMTPLLAARSVAVKPSILLLDEPTSALDPISTLTIEELINELKSQFTVVIVTHNMQQAARVSDQTAFMYMGELIEYSNTNTIFTTPAKKKTEDYITGRYG